MHWQYEQGFGSHVLAQTDAHRIRNGLTLYEAKFELMGILVFLEKRAPLKLARLQMNCEGKSS